MMTRKDYKAIAAIIAGDYATAKDESDRLALKVRGIACSLADYFAQDNPRFDRRRFYNACGFDVGVTGFPMDNTNNCMGCLEGEGAHAIDCPYRVDREVANAS